MPETSNAGETARLHSWLRVMLPALIVAAAVTFWLAGGAEYLSLARLAAHRTLLREWVDAHFIMAILVYMAVYAAAVALSLPIGAALTITGGFLFGWLAGGMATVLAATTGAALIFLLVRGALAEFVRRKAGPRLEKLRRGFQRNAVSYLLFLRLVPVFPFWLVNLAPPLLGMRFRGYVGATFVGIMPVTFALSLAGAGFDGMIAAHEEAYARCIAQSSAASACSLDFRPESLLSPELLFALGAFGVIALLPIMAKRIFYNGNNGQQGG